MRAWVAGAVAGMAVSAAAGNSIENVAFPDFQVTGAESVMFTETLSPGFEAYGLRLQADWTTPNLSWSSELEAIITAPNGDSFSWTPVGGDFNASPTNFDITRFLAFPFGTEADGDWTFEFRADRAGSIQDLANVQVDLIEVETYNYEGEFVHDSPTWVRPEEFSDEPADFAPHSYHVQEFQVEEDGIFDIYSEHDGIDGLIYLYEGEFDPEAPLTNLIDRNNGLRDTESAELIGLELEAGQSYFLVTSTFGFCELGHFRNVIGGTSGIVPEPASLGLLALGGLALLRRK